MPNDIKLDEHTTVVVEVRAGIVCDYYRPKGIKVFVVDRDIIGRAPDEVDDITLAAMRLLEENR